MKRLFFVALAFILCSCCEAWAGDKYVVPCRADIFHKSMEILNSSVGIKEKTGRNDGPAIEAMLASVGRRRGDAWCAAFQYYAFARAVTMLGYTSQEIPIARTGLANGIYNFAAKSGRRDAFAPRYGDLLVWKNRGSYSGHIERIIAVHAGGYVTTIGGNTGGISFSDGDGVYKKRRNVRSPIGRMLVRGLVGFSLN